MKSRAAFPKEGSLSCRFSLSIRKLLPQGLHGFCLIQACFKGSLTVFSVAPSSQGSHMNEFSMAVAKELFAV